MDESRVEALFADLRERALADEPNTVYPDSPTLTGWLNVLLRDVVELKARVEDLERGA